MADIVSRGPYKARVEILQCKDMILDLLPKGYSAIMIYELLCGDGKITMTYRHFCRCLIKYCGVQVRAKKEQGFASAIMSYILEAVFKASSRYDIAW